MEFSESISNYCTEKVLSGLKGRLQPFSAIIMEFRIFSEVTVEFSEIGMRQVVRGIYLNFGKFHHNRRKKPKFQRDLGKRLSGRTCFGKGGSQFLVRIFSAVAMENVFFPRL